jgi:hypothetical protein
VEKGESGERREKGRKEKGGFFFTDSLFFIFCFPPSLSPLLLFSLPLSK